MLLQKSIPCSCIFITVLVTILPATSGAQNRPPQRPLDVPYVPTTEVAVEAMLKLAAVTKDDIVFDLGCGDGRIVIAAASKFGSHGVGVDIDPARIKDAKENARKAGVTTLVRFEERDLFKADIHEASVVTLFLLSSVNLKLRPKLLAELRAGSRIVSNTFDMGDWKADKEATVGDALLDIDFSRKLYLWIVPRHAP
jgi:ribosomal protein L11 methylase PrmA